MMNFDKKSVTFLHLIKFKKIKNLLFKLFATTQLHIFQSEDVCDLNLREVNGGGFYLPLRLLRDHEGDSVREREMEFLFQNKNKYLIFNSLKFICVFKFTTWGHRREGCEILLRFVSKPQIKIYIPNYLRNLRK